MPIEVGVWRIDGAVARLEPSKLAEEARLEDFIAADVSLVRGDLWVIGRQVATEHGGFIDLLAMDAQGNLVVLELKRDKTPREVVAQVLDYASWVKALGRGQIAAIYDHYIKKHKRPDVPFDRAFAERFGGQVPETLNESHELIVVAAALDDSTERIIGYVEEYGVPVNAVFFRVFKDEQREYLTRAWLRDPAEAQSKTEEAQARQKGKEPWNGTDYYIAYGGRNWDDAVRYGFISAGGGKWYTSSLDKLRPDHRVFVCIPGKGYVGIGKVVEPAVRIREFMVVGTDGKQTPIADVDLKGREILKSADDDERTERLVRVKWLKTVSESDVVWEKGMFANQNSACKLANKFTVDRLIEKFGIKE